MKSKVTVVLPSLLSKLAGGRKKIQVSASTLGEALEKLRSMYGDSLAERLFEPTGEPKRLLNFYVNGKNARLCGFLNTELRDGDEIVIMPGVSGG
ncbi:MAG: MoaD family protein [Candidatus Bathyarchaeia archaeon]|nr:MoaD family protein [Candidatus Bathyarchaeota archaeon]